MKRCKLYFDGLSFDIVDSPWTSSCVPDDWCLVTARSCIYTRCHRDNPAAVTLSAPQPGDSRHTPRCHVPSAGGFLSSIRFVHVIIIRIKRILSQPETIENKLALLLGEAQLCLPYVCLRSRPIYPNVVSQSVCLFHLFKNWSKQLYKA